MEGNVSYIYLLWLTLIIMGALIKLSGWINCDFPTSTCLILNGMGPLGAQCMNFGTHTVHVALIIKFCF